MAKAESYSVMYSRPPLFMEVHAPSPLALREKIEKIDRQIDEADERVIRAKS